MHKLRDCFFSTLSSALTTISATTTTAITTFQVRVRILTIIYQQDWLTRVSHIFGDTLILWRMQEHEFYFGHYQNKMKTGFSSPMTRSMSISPTHIIYASALFYVYQLDMKEYPIKGPFGYFSEYGVQPNVSGRFPEIPHPAMNSSWIDPGGWSILQNRSFIRRISIKMSIAW